MPRSYHNDASGVMPMMVEWPGRCSSCDKQIVDWSDAGLHGRRWIHKVCYADRWNQAHAGGKTPPELQSPIDRGRLLELPMLVFLLMFHFGLGVAVAGWIMIDQDQTPDVGALLLVIGLVAPLIGVGGVALNIISRRRIELIRQALELQGGWKPGR
jgi:hypothetical protein